MVNDRDFLALAVIPGRERSERPSDAQLRIGESRDSGFALTRAPE
jgi:hypothetical protein